MDILLYICLLALALLGGYLLARKRYYLAWAVLILGIIVQIYRLHENNLVMTTVSVMGYVLTVIVASWAFEALEDRAARKTKK